MGKTAYGERPPPPCYACKSTTGVRHFQICVDLVPLRVQPFFCGACGDRYLLRVGRVIGEMLRDGRPQ